MGRVTQAAMERVKELQKMLMLVEPPKRLMMGFKKWAQERMRENISKGTTGISGMTVNLKDPEVQAVIISELNKEGPDADEVYPALFVGNGKSALDINYLKSRQITHVVNMAEGDTIMPIRPDMKEYKKNNISYYGAVCSDEDEDDISKHFVPTANFIEEASAAGGRVIVNCVGSISRSSTIATSFLLQKRGMTLEVALTSLRKKRDVSPNEGFLLKLVELENLLRK